MKFKAFFIFLFIISCGEAAEYYQATAQINVRSGPGKDYSIVGSIAKGDSVIVDSIISEWGQVIINNKLKGYASMEYLTSEFHVYPDKSKLNHKTVGQQTNKTKTEKKGFVDNFWQSFLLSLIAVWVLSQDRRAKDARFKVGTRLVAKGLRIGCITQIVISVGIALIYSCYKL